MVASSGVYRETFDLDIVCLHTGDGEGVVQAWEDREAHEWGYRCHCGHEVVHHINDRAELDDGLAQVLVIILSAAAAVAVIGLLGRAWPLLITAVIVGALIITLALTKGTRKDQS